MDGSRTCYHWDQCGCLPISTGWEYGSSMFFLQCLNNPILNTDSLSFHCIHANNNPLRSMQAYSAHTQLNTLQMNPYDSHMGSSASQAASQAALEACCEHEEYIILLQDRLKNTHQRLMEQLDINQRQELQILTYKQRGQPRHQPSFGYNPDEKQSQPRSTHPEGGHPPRDEYPDTFTRDNDYHADHRTNVVFPFHKGQSNKKTTLHHNPHQSLHNHTPKSHHTVLQSEEKELSFAGRSESSLSMDNSSLRSIHEHKSKMDLLQSDLIAMRHKVLTQVNLNSHLREDIKSLKKMHEQQTKQWEKQSYEAKSKLLQLSKTLEIITEENHLLKIKNQEDNELLQIQKQQCSNLLAKLQHLEGLLSQHHSFERQAQAVFAQPASHALSYDFTPSIQSLSASSSKSHKVQGSILHKKSSNDHHQSNPQRHQSNLQHHQNHPKRHQRNQQRHYKPNPKYQPLENQTYFHSGSHDYPTPQYHTDENDDINHQNYTHKPYTPQTSLPTPPHADQQRHQKVSYTPHKANHIPDQALYTDVHNAHNKVNNYPDSQTNANMNPYDHTYPPKTVDPNRGQCGSIQRQTHTKFNTPLKTHTKTPLHAQTNNPHPTSHVSQSTSHGHPPSSHGHPQTLPQYSRSYQNQNVTKKKKGFEDTKEFIRRLEEMEAKVRNKQKLENE